jgi:hypothetical protein
MNIPFEAIKEKLAVFGKVMDVEENLNAGLSRSVFISVAQVLAPKTLNKDTNIVVAHGWNHF